VSTFSQTLTMKYKSHAGKNKLNLELLENMQIFRARLCRVS